MMYYIIQWEKPCGVIPSRVYRITFKKCLAQVPCHIVQLFLMTCNNTLFEEWKTWKFKSRTAKIKLQCRAKLKKTVRKLQNVTTM